MKPSHRTTPPLIITLLCLLILGVTTQLPSLTHAQGQVQVTAADPAAAEQGTVNLNVRVTGKGFKNGARAQWFVTGTTNPGGVTVNSTTFVSSTELTANITVDDAATIANFDIQVLNSDGRGGKGTELFAVTTKGQGQTSCGADVINLSVSVFKYTDATNTTTYNLQPDLVYADGSPVPYVTGGKSKTSSILAKFQIDNCTYDFTLSLGSSRYLTYKFPDGSPLGTSVDFGFFNIDRVGNVPITDGGPAFLNWCSQSNDNYAGCGVDANGYFVRRAYGSTLTHNNEKVRFNYSPLDIGTGIQLSAGTAYVKVYRADAITWVLMPEQVAPPPGVIGTNGEWSAMLDINIPAVINYQKIPFKIMVKRL